MEPAAWGRVLIVIPAYNEAEAIAGVVQEVHEAMPAADILVVDDGSDDDTTVVARRAGALVAQLPFNLGVGGAVRTGMRHALEMGYDAVVQIDGDGQHDPSYLPAVLAPLLDGYDVVIGGRFAGEGDYQVRGPRKWAMKVLSWLMSRILRTPVTDSTSGFRVAGRRAIHVFAQHYPAEYLGDTVESLVISRKTGLRAVQVPVAMRDRTTGQASQGMVSSVVYLVRAGGAMFLALVRRWPVKGLS